MRNVYTATYLHVTWLAAPVAVDGATLSPAPSITLAIEVAASRRLFKVLILLEVTGWLSLIYTRVGG
jgi:hypothetical protein